jgi:hypothetical protein
MNIKTSEVFAFRTATALADLPAGGSLQGVITPATDHDWYRCIVTEESNCRFQIQLVNLTDSEIWLYGPGDRTFERLYDDNTGGGNASQIDAWHLQVPTICAWVPRVKLKPAYIVVNFATGL